MIDARAVRSKAGRKAASEQLRLEAEAEAPTAQTLNHPRPSPITAYGEVAV
jgi:hypothetical protein